MITLISSLKFLIKHTEAVQKQNNDEYLPLHIACDYRAFNCPIKILFENYYMMLQAASALWSRHQKAWDHVLIQMFTTGNPLLTEGSMWCASIP
jgi:hypothetical protein